MSQTGFPSTAPRDFNSGGERGGHPLVLLRPSDSLPSKSDSQTCAENIQTQLSKDSNVR